MTIFLTIIIFIAGLCTVICIHELGHLLTAKWFNVYCEEFSIGFGPNLIHINPKDKKTKKPMWETSINIRCIPLGGYVAMIGDDEDDDLNNEDPDRKPIPKERTFNAVNHGKQAIIMIAGILMNVVLSYVLFFCANFFCKTQDAYTNKVNIAQHYSYSYGSNKLENLDTAFYSLGVRSNDEVVDFSISIGEQGLKFVDGTGYTLTDAQVDHLKNDIGVELNLNNHLSKEQINYSSLSESLTNVLFKRNSLTGYEYYDRDGNKINLSNKNNNEKIVFYLPKDTSATMTLSIKYLTFESDYTVEKESEQTFNALEITSSNEGSNPYYFFPSMGVKPYMTYSSFKTPSGSKIEGDDHMSWKSFRDSLAKSFVDQGSGVSNVFKAIGSLFTPSGWQNVGGIISIFTTTEQAVELGAYYVLWVWGMISINLAVMNLIPIPGLDGWQLLLCIIESITRKKVSKKFKTIASIIGFSFVGVLAILLIILDIVRLFI